MALMTFLKPNFINTTTQIVVDAANTSTITNIFDRNIETKWETVGYATTTATIFSIEFSTATVINKIYLQNHNLKQFSIHYNSLTSNTFSPDINVDNNSATSHYFDFTSITVSSVQLQLDQQITAGSEKSVGEFYIGETLLDFERNPSAPDYKPDETHAGVIHRMPNGGVSKFIVDRKFRASLKWKYVTSSFETSLKNIYDTGTTIVFLPFPTMTSWDAKAYECAWTNRYDFRHSSNNKDAGFGGQIKIEETA